MNRCSGVHVEMCRTICQSIRRIELRNEELFMRANEYEMRISHRIINDKEFDWCFIRKEGNGFPYSVEQLLANRCQPLPCRSKTSTTAPKRVSISRLCAMEQSSATLLKGIILSSRERFTNGTGSELVSPRSRPRFTAFYVPRPLVNGCPEPLCAATPSDGL